MVLGRYAVTGKFLYAFLLWNLFLAVVPYAVALLMRGAAANLRGRRTKAASVVVLSLLWLVFYPNAPYLFTDFIYLFKRTFVERPAGIPVGSEAIVWYDIVMSSAFAFVGHFIGLVSAYFVHGVLRSTFGRVVSWAVIALAMVMSGFGIYLGRFSRLNSWDLVTRPAEAFAEVFSSLGDFRAILFSAVFSLFVGVTYLMLYAFKRARF